MMQRKLARYPYDKYYLYIVFHKKEGRNYANLISIEKGNRDRKTISYARYLMSVKEKRILEKWEQVDHKDNDKTNDDIDNLQIITIRQNNIKAAKHRGKHMATIQCPMCGKIFDKPYNQTHIGKKQGRYTSCSRNCSAKFENIIRMNSDKSNIQSRLKNNIIRIYHVTQKL